MCVGADELGVCIETFATGLKLGAFVGLTLESIFEVGLKLGDFVDEGEDSTFPIMQSKITVT